MPLGPCLQSLCPLCNARSYPHPRTITGLSLAALWGQDAGRGVAVHSPSHGFRLVGVGALAARPRSQDPRLGSSCGQGADAPWGSCRLCSSLWCACSGRGCRSRSQTWRASGEDWQRTTGSRVSPVLLASFLFVPFLHTQLSQEMASSLPPAENLPHIPFAPTSTPCHLQVNRRRFPLKNSPPTLSSAKLSWEEV